MTSGTSVPETSDRITPVAAVVPLVPAWRVGKEFDYAIPDKLAGRIAAGHLVRVPFGKRKVRGIVTAVDERLVDRQLESIISVVIAQPVAPPPMTDLLWWVARRYVCPAGRAFEKAVPPRVRVSPRPLADMEAGPEPHLVSGYEGGDALIELIAAGGKGTFLFQVTPGEDRVTLIAELVAAVSQGAAVVTVPEVKYGSVVLDGLAAMWPGAARVDAGRSDADRAQGWIEGAAGARLILGGRSAVFAPAPELRLIVVDEEHHPTYKEDRAPRYDARRVARERARLQGAVCVLMSPSPSLETTYDVREGRIRRVVPTRPASKAARPIVELVPLEPGRSLAHALHERISDALHRSERVGLLAPRSGFANAVWCAACRRSLRCERCEAGLASAEGGRGLRCPRCSWRGLAPERCPSCGADEFKQLGAGSERLAEQVAASFPRAKVVRVDPDALAVGGRPDPKADIYLTTWIGAKEILRPKVSLVGVLSIDPLIRRPDFRAAERAYRVLAEMSEWAGPSSAGGRLVIQTEEPSHHVVQAIVRGDHLFFASRELEQRGELRYPPFSELIKVTSSGSGGPEALEHVARVAREAGASVLGPVPAPAITSAEGAQELLIKAAEAAVITDAIRPIVEGLPSGTRLRVDVDPR